MNHHITGAIALATGTINYGIGKIVTSYLLILTKVAEF